MRPIAVLVLLLVLACAAPAAAAPPVCAPAAFALEADGTRQLPLECPGATVALAGQPTAGRVDVSPDDGTLSYSHEGEATTTAFPVDVTRDGTTARLTVQIGFKRESQPSCGLLAPVAVRPNRRVRIPLTCATSGGRTTDLRLAAEQPHAGVGSATVATDGLEYAASSGEGVGDVDVRVARGDRAETVRVPVEVTASANAVPTCAVPDRERVRPETIRRLPLSCTDGDGDTLTVRVERPPTAGSVSAVRQATGAGGASLEFTSPREATAADEDLTFRFVADDGRSTSAPVTFAIAVSADFPDLRPSCAARDLFVDPGTTVRTTSNCRDDELRALRFALGDAEHVDVELLDQDGDEAVFEFTSEPGYVGPARFEYTATDRAGQVARGVTQITVGDEPPPRCSPPARGILRSGRFATVDLTRICSGADGFELGTLLLDEKLLDVARSEEQFFI